MNDLPRHLLLEQELTAEDKALCLRVKSEWHGRGELVFQVRGDPVRMIVLLGLGTLLICPFLWSFLRGQEVYGLLSILGLLGLLAFYGAIRESGRVRGGNEIVLKDAEFVEKKVTTLGSTSESGIPWNRLSATETIDTGEYEGRSIVISDTTSGRKVTYDPADTPRYDELRAALILRIGLEVLNKHWHRD